MRLTPKLPSRGSLWSLSPVSQPDPAAQLSTALPAIGPDLEGDPVSVTHNSQTCSPAAWLKAQLEFYGDLGVMAPALPHPTPPPAWAPHPRERAVVRGPSSSSVHLQQRISQVSARPVHSRFTVTLCTNLDSLAWESWLGGSQGQRGFGKMQPPGCLTSAAGRVVTALGGSWCPGWASASCGVTRLHGHKVTRQLVSRQSS